ncbi:Peptidyl-prolyl cis-trans isomerase cyp15 [Coemansia sp. RSA 1199]|nr:Peptidyl-prolyl cis-trans isomerase cyp15 [Coemansia sp. RSA 1199]
MSEASDKQERTEKRTNESAPAPAAKKHAPVRSALDHLPSAQMYSRSYMHRSNVTHTCVTRTNFVLTMSCDGHVKFWKKRDSGIEFVKDFCAHLSGIGAYAVSQDGQLFATCSKDPNDTTIKIFDVVSFDMIAIITAESTPSALCWARDPVDQSMCVVVADSQRPVVRTYGAYAGAEPRRTIETVHKQPVVLMAYSPVLECIVSADRGGMLEYWTLDSPLHMPPTTSFTLKSQTDLYEFKKGKSVPNSLEFSPDFSLFACTASDASIRVFRASTGKLYRKYDESVSACNAMQSNDERFKLDSMEFGRRLVTEAELLKTPGHANAVFDSSGQYVLFASLFGIKIVNLSSNKVVRVLGKPEPHRFTSIALSQDSNGPILFCTGVKRNRFYMFTNEEPDHTGQGSDRDVFNERPTREEASLAVRSSTQKVTAHNAVLHTTLGDIRVVLFPDHAPKAVENFVSLSRNGYYNGVIFHRVIKGFMVQTGDPLGDGTGGESVWGRMFEDEFTPVLRHDRPYTLSMANAGPATNGSQFFITTVDKAPWLDDKHTVFGRVEKGMDVVQQIEQAKTDKQDKPVDDISILNITTTSQ